MQVQLRLRVSWLGWGEWAHLITAGELSSPVLGPISDTTAQKSGPKEGQWRWQVIHHLLLAEKELKWSNLFVKQFDNTNAEPLKRPSLWSLLFLPMIRRMTLTRIPNKHAVPQCPCPGSVTSHHYPWHLGCFSCLSSKIEVTGKTRWVQNQNVSLHFCEQGVKPLLVEGRMGIILAILLSTREGSCVYSHDIAKAIPVCKALCSVLGFSDTLDPALPPWEWDSPPCSMSSLHGAATSRFPINTCSANVSLPKVTKALEKNGVGKERVSSRERKVLGN